MAEYRIPVRDMRFVMEEIAGLDDIATIEGFEDADAESVAGLLEEAARFFEEVVAPTNQVGDQQGSVWDNGDVTTPKAFHDAYAKLSDSGWSALSAPAEYGGGGMPWLVCIAINEMLLASNPAFSMLPGLTTGAIDLLLHHADETQRETYLPKMVSGEWAGTMNLTEPEAGSDVGALRTRAVPQEDGSYRIFGTKIFISFGEQDITDNIIHLVLARTPDAPPGTKGISCFIVPKYLVNDDGTPGERNDVRCVSIEHKMGIKASPTCVMAYGDDGEGAIGYLIGEENRGMRYMFTMMNNARLSVGLSGLAIGERAYQHALQFATERVQGKPIGAPGDLGPTPTIIEHADVRRMLLTMKSQVDAMRALVYLNAAALDLAKSHPDPDVREHNQHYADLLTPITKAWCTDTGCDVASLAIQIHGGMGFIEETGVAQYYRDLRIGPIYEGTNGIQALDFVGRKLPLAGGKPVLDLIAEIKETADLLAGAGPSLEAAAASLAAGIATVEDATLWIMEHGLADPGDAVSGATPYLRMFGTVVGGWLLAREALAAQRLLDDGASVEDRPYLEAKAVTARFYLCQLLPTAAALLPAVTAGKDDLYVLDADELASR